MASLIGGIIGVAIVSLIFTGVFMTTYKGVNTTAGGYTASETSLWNTIGIVAIAGFILLVLRSFGIES